MEHPNRTSPAAIAALLVGYGTRWAIGLDFETGAWVAERRPTPTSLRIIAALAPAELAEKLAAAEAAEPDVRAR